MTDADMLPVYCSPELTDQPHDSGAKRGKGTAISVLMIIAGGFFCIASFYVCFSHGLDSFWRQSRHSPIVACYRADKLALGLLSKSDG
jgi:hypothetical protein